MLHGEQLMEDASLRNLGDGKGTYVADALERVLLLPTDMEELKNTRMQEAIQATYRMEEEAKGQSKITELERNKRIEAVRTLKNSEADLAKVREDLKEVTRARDSAEADNAKGVAEWVRDEAVRTKTEAEFTKTEAETTKDKAEEEAYDVWNEALKRVRVEASSDLWKAESVFYPEAIRETASVSSEAVSIPQKAEAAQSEAAQLIVIPGE
ncbi:uncharacterized protein LOC115950231 [Quercus lobata]|uniref:uncharacterized protein LOC115950231 n=1 Tax=Quercus lobata TaxID=97700 RepID=UPI00124577C6|nr:uncharacterized protein LOC115950231 [Quercus lobata]